MPVSAEAPTVEPPPVLVRPEQVAHPSRRAVGKRFAGAFRLKRIDVHFQYDRNGVIDIAFTLVNHGSQPSPAQQGVIEEAPFGAFVPWRPLTTFEVPSLNPGQSTRVHLQVPRTAPAGREPPDPPPTARVRRLLDAISGLARTWNTGDPTEDADVPCFAGNLNVHIGSESVERHLSGPLRVHAGRLNYAMFFVGEGTDSYRFDLRGEAAYWDAFLCEAITFHFTDGELELGQWYPGTMGHVFLALHPPAECRQGAVEVLVEQQSTGRVAVVEFDLDPQSLGAACYTV